MQCSVPLLAGTARPGASGGAAWREGGSVILGRRFYSTGTMQFWQVNLKPRETSCLRVSLRQDLVTGALLFPIHILLFWVFLHSLVSTQEVSESMLIFKCCSILMICTQLVANHTLLLVLQLLQLDHISANFNKYYVKVFLLNYCLGCLSL